MGPGGCNCYGVTGKSNCGAGSPQAAGNFSRYVRIARGGTGRLSFSSNSFAIRSSPTRGLSRAIWRIRRWTPAEFVASQIGIPCARATGSPCGANPKKFHTIAAYSLDPNEWLKQKFTDIHTGRSYSTTTSSNAGPHVIRVKCYGDVFDEYKLHPASKSAGLDGNPCGPHTRGVLLRRHIVAAFVERIGKESNRLEEVEHEEILDIGDVQERYQEPRDDPWSELVIPILKLIPHEKLARIAGVTERAIQALRNGRWKPNKKTRTKLFPAAGEFARSQLNQNIRNNLCACAVFIDMGISMLQGTNDYVGAEKNRKN